MTVRLTFALAALLFCAACAEQHATATPAERESQRADALEKQYAGVIMGSEVKGTTLTLYIDVNGMNGMDEDAEIAMKRNALGFWKKTWSQDHPRAHSTLTLLLRDFTGSEVYRKRVSV
ncbi:MAG: hypothetical protein M3Z07_03045 [Candidatus Eremiobacteraeota bacterium]|nr:hypothetical protein [Candidatus Eremiobacteraeota bacterium]